MLSACRDKTSLNPFPLWFVIEVKKEASDDEGMHRVISKPSVEGSIVEIPPCSSDLCSAAQSESTTAIEKRRIERERTPPERWKIHPSVY